MKIAKFKADIMTPAQTADVPIVSQVKVAEFGDFCVERKVDLGLSVLWERISRYLQND